MSANTFKKFIGTSIFIATLVLTACAPNSAEHAESSTEDSQGEDFPQDDPHTGEGHDHEAASDDMGLLDFLTAYACKSASSRQLDTVDQGNAKYDEFLDGCLRLTGSTKWCEQLTRPNPSSKSTFKCTYGPTQPHRLINPDESTWNNAYEAVLLVVELEAQGVSVSQIYNWWRPEPYNGNVGGAAGRHPYGTSVDVRFSSMSHMKKAHKLLCRMRAQGRLRALGYYGSTGLHLGVGDRTANTWGKICPK